MDAALIEHFPALAGYAKSCVHGFVRRVPDIDVNADRATVLERLEAAHRVARRMLALERRPFVTAEQVHGAEVAVIDAETTLPPGAMRGIDALVTDQHYCLGIHVADCAAVYLFDPLKHVIGLVHAGRKGAEKEIVPRSIKAMVGTFGCNPADILLQISPCIRPPNFEMDLSALIVEQAKAVGVTKIHDCGIDTHADPERYYSYRRDLGKTGRMLALLALR